MHWTTVKADSSITLLQPKQDIVVTWFQPLPRHSFPEAHPAPRHTTLPWQSLSHPGTAPHQPWCPRPMGGTATLISRLIVIHRVNCGGSTTGKDKNRLQALNLVLGIPRTRAEGLCSCFPMCIFNTAISLVTCNCYLFILGLRSRTKHCCILVRKERYLIFENLSHEQGGNQRK